MNCTYTIIRNCTYTTNGKIEEWKMLLQVLEINNKWSLLSQLFNLQVTCSSSFSLYNFLWSFESLFFSCLFRPPFSRWGWSACIGCFFGWKTLFLWVYQRCHLPLWSHFTQTTILVFLWAFLAWWLGLSPGVVTRQAWSIALPLCEISSVNCSVLLFPIVMRLNMITV